MNSFEAKLSAELHDNIMCVDEPDHHDREGSVLGQLRWGGASTRSFLGI